MIISAILWALQQMAVPACASIIASMLSKYLEDKDHEGWAMVVRIGTALGVGVFWMYPKLEHIWFDINRIGNLLSPTVAPPIGEDAARQLMEEAQKYQNLMKPDMTGVPRPWWGKAGNVLHNIFYEPASPHEWQDFSKSFTDMFGPAQAVKWLNELSAAIWEVVSK